MNERQLSVRTNSAKRSKVSELGFLIGRWLKNYLSAWRPSLLGITVYKDVMSMVKKPSSETLLRLAELVLTLYCFSFIHVQ